MAVGESTDVETLQKVLGGTGLAFGAAALLAPRALMSAYGMQPPAGESVYVARMWGARMAFIGTLSMAVTGEARRTSFLLGSVMGAVDAVLALTTPGLSTRTRVQGTVTSAVIGATAAYALRES
jgi:hypothetical protein